MSDDTRSFNREIFTVAFPITIQSIFQASLSVIDQIMVGQLGSISIAGIGLGSKFASLFSVTVAAVATALGIQVSQYYGNDKQNHELANTGINNSLKINVGVSTIIAMIFTIISLCGSKMILGLYSGDKQTIEAGALYLFIIAIGFIPQVLSLMLSTLLRSIGYARYPMYASVLSVLTNTVLNYVLIFGKFGMPHLGLKGAAIATTIARFVEFIIILIEYVCIYRKSNWIFRVTEKVTKQFKVSTITILWPVLVCEFMWSLGENVYAVIYGRLGTDACAAMTLTNPIQSIMIGAFTGLSAASGILIGKELGNEKFDKAYDESKKMLKYGLVGTITFGFILAVLSKYYVMLFNVKDDVKQTTVYILFAYAVVVSVKVQNMILGGGILRSGGNTKILMFIDIIGTWGFGVPLGLMASYVFHLPVYLVYFVLSMEECVRLSICIHMFRKKKWMKNLTTEI